MNENGDQTAETELISIEEAIAAGRAVFGDVLTQS
jgi:hypothetical protein